MIYGPIVLAGALGNKVAPGADLHVNERTIGEPFNDPIEVPVLVGDLAKMAAKIKPTDSPLTFRTDGLGRPAEVTLSPITASPTNTTTSIGESLARETTDYALVVQPLAGRPTPSRSLLAGSA